MGGLAVGLKVFFEKRGIGVLVGAPDGFAEGLPLGAGVGSDARSRKDGAGVVTVGAGVGVSVGPRVGPRVGEDVKPGRITHNSWMYSSRLLK